jgi:hypothetical protein
VIAAATRAFFRRPVPGLGEPRLAWAVARVGTIGISGTVEEWHAYGYTSFVRQSIDWPPCGTHRPQQAHLEGIT